MPRRLVYLTLAGVACSAPARSPEPVRPAPAVASSGHPADAAVVPPPPAPRPPSYAEPIPTSARIAIHPVTARDGVLPFRLYEGAVACAMLSLFRIEGIQTTTGVARWSTAEWSRVLGELADGALVVLGDAEAGRANLRVGVIERASGAVRFACEAGADLGSLASTWEVAEGGLRTGLTVPRRVTGTAMPEVTTLSPVQLTISSTACALSRPVGGSGSPWTPPHTWRANGLVIQEPGGASVMGVAEDVLVARRGAAIAWRRTAKANGQPPCALP